VAELTRRDRENRPAPSLQELARALGASPRAIAEDIRILTLLGDHADAEWLLSLCVWQQGDRVSVSSAGPFRRPVRLTPAEMLAVQVALALDPDGEPLALRFAALWAGRPPPSRPTHGEPPDDPTDTDPRSLLRLAATEHRQVRLLYAGEGDREGREWAVDPYQLADYRNRTYLVAWCEEAAGWRHFRLDRVLATRLTSQSFAPRRDFAPVTRPEEVFRPGAELDQVTVRFAPAVARWVRERYPGSEPGPGGAVVVRFRASSPQWLVRRVLEYGPDAEVLEPERYREAMRRALVASPGN
jgi:predicted DNA-binding transcriptional regulator YafY